MNCGLCGFIIGKHDYKATNHEICKNCETNLNTGLTPQDIIMMVAKVKNRHVEQQLNGRVTC